MHLEIHSVYFSNTNRFIVVKLQTNTNDNNLVIYQLKDDFQSLIPVFADRVNDLDVKHCTIDFCMNDE